MSTNTKDQTAQAWDAIKAIRSHFAAHLDVARADGNADGEKGARELLAHLEVLRVWVEYTPDDIAAAVEADRAQRQPTPEYKVNDPDPTPDHNAVACEARDGRGFLCTWPKGHGGAHVAGDGQYICAVWS